MSSLVVIHPINNTCNNIFKARLSILILSKKPSRGKLHHQTLDMRGFLAGEVLLLKSNKECALTFNILAQVVVDYYF
jgi:hypothetical protein